MKKTLVILLFSIFNFFTLKSQVCTTLVASDRIETYDWLGAWWIPSTTSGYYTNASTSPTVSAAIYGLGSGTSSVEADWYVLPNITGLNPSFSYFFKFRLGSYRFTSTNSSRGVDINDFIEVQISTDGEITYVSEIRITGNNNAFWDYNTNGIINKTSNGTLTTYTPANGGDRTTIGDGYSVITLNLPTNITQIAIDVYSRVNAAGEEWWFDDFELYQIAPCIPLPIELVSFNGINYKIYNHLTWVTATELNNEYFNLERSKDGINWVDVDRINGSGTVSTPSYYEYSDHNYYKESINYYRLKQVDFDGNFKYSQIISVISPEIKIKKLLKIISIDGKEVDESYRGFVTEIYSDGTVIRLIKQ